MAILFAILVEMSGTFLNKNHYDLVVVGAGIVGATFANLISRASSELTVAVIDAGDGVVFDLDTCDPRVYAITKESELIFERAGVWQSVKQLRVCPYRKMHVWDGEGTADITFDCESLGMSHLGHIVENAALVSCLSAELARVRQVEVVHGLNVVELEMGTDGENATLTLNNDQQVSTPLVVGADGAKSRLRDLSGFDFHESGYGQTAIVTTVQTEKPHQFTAWQRFSEDGPLAFLPLAADERKCSIVWSLNEASAEKLIDTSDSDFCRYLGRTFEYRLGDVVSADTRISFPLMRRHAKTYIKPGLVLVGDAAHTIHPLAGQGANLGLYDVNVLSDEISRAVSRDLPLHDASILKRYERRRRAHNQIAMTAMDGFKSLFGSDSLPLRWLRNEGLRRVNGNAWLKNQLAKLASGQV